MVSEAAIPFRPDGPALYEHTVDTAAFAMIAFCACSSGTSTPDLSTAPRDASATATTRDAPARPGDAPLDGDGLSRFIEEHDHGIANIPATDLSHAQFCAKVARLPEVAKLGGARAVHPDPEVFEVGPRSTGGGFEPYYWCRVMRGGKTWRHYGTFGMNDSKIYACVHRDLGDCYHADDNIDTSHTAGEL